MSTFAKRHYEAIALVFQAECPGAHWDPNKRVQWELLRDAMATLFRSDNTRFNPERFKRACEPGANVRARNSGGLEAGA